MAMVAAETAINSKTSWFDSRNDSNDLGAKIVPIDDHGKPVRHDILTKQVFDI